MQIFSAIKPGKFSYVVLHIIQLVLFNTRNKVDILL